MVSIKVSAACRYDVLESMLITEMVGNVLGMALVTGSTGMGGKKYRAYQVKKFVQSLSYQKPKEQFLQKK